jgi:hypothetical protein
MPQSRSIFMIALLVGLAACADNSTSPTLPGDAGTALAGKGGGPTDPTATWTLPAPDGILGFASDGQGAYVDGACGVSATIFATPAGSNSGDATIQTSKGKCTRRFALRYPDGTTESVLSFNNLLQLQNTTYSIPINTTVKRRLILNPGAIASNPSRCGRILFGVNGTVGVGSDSVNVTRTSANSWQVQSAASNLAYCEANGALYAMPVSFTVTASAPLP